VLNDEPRQNRVWRRGVGGLRLALALLVVGCGDVAAPGASDRRLAPRPNIVLVMAEDLGPRIGAYGDRVAQTPNLDRLASEGARYTRAFTTSGVCGPSRAAIITGVHQNVWGAGHMRAAAGGYAASPPPHVKAFPELLRASGYYTVNDGKTDYQMGLRLGGAFGGPATLWDDPSSGDWRARAPGQPFFAYVNLTQTHESQVWPTFMLPDDWLTLVLWPIRIWNHLQWPLETDPARVALPPYYSDTPTARADLARHYNNIALMDEALGGLLDRIDAEGLAERTIVIFSADHGDGLPRAKRWLYDAGLHVPLIIRWPGETEPGSVHERLVSGVDLAPTILAMADVPVPEWMPGRVLLGHGAAPTRRYVYAARDRIDEQPDTVRAVRDTRWKYVRHYRPELPYVQEGHFRDQMPMMRELRALHAQGLLSAEASLWFRARRDREELFDTESDPHELRNLAGEPGHEATLARLRGALDDWLDANEDLGLRPEAELRRAFFPDGEQPVTAAPRLDVEAGLAHAESSTEGASIEVRIDDGPWQLYARPIPISPGQALAARAERYGWKPSDTVRVRAPEPARPR